MENMDTALTSLLTCSHMDIITNILLYNNITYMNQIFLNLHKNNNYTAFLMFFFLTFSLIF